MAPVVPDPARIRDFPDQAAFLAWLARHHADETELWLKLHKKDSGLPSVTYPEAVEAALCWGWIDGQRKGLDALSFLQRFTPRGAKSIWSRKNVEHVGRLTAAGRMQAPGLAQVEAARADGRWDRAYAPASQLAFSPELLAAIAAEPEAQTLFEKLDASNRYAMFFRLHNLKTEAGRQKRIAGFVAMLKRGETIYPLKGK